MSEGITPLSEVPKPENYLIKRYPEMRQMSGIDAVTRSDVTGTITLMDFFDNVSFKGKNIQEGYHGQNIAKFLQPLYPFIERVELGTNILMAMASRTPNVEVAGFLQALEDLNSANESGKILMPGVVSMSAEIPWPSINNLKLKAERLKTRKGFIRNLWDDINSKSKRWIEERTTHLSAGIEMAEKAGSLIDSLRNKGFVFLAATSNHPNSMESKDMLDFSMPIIFPGVIGVGGIIPAKDGGYEMLGTRELATIKSVSIASIDEEIIVGNSIATPTAAIGADMILNNNRRLRLFASPSEREKVIVSELQKASRQVPIIEQRRAPDGKSYVPVQTTTSVLDLSLLKSNLQKK